MAGPVRQARAAGTRRRRRGVAEAEHFMGVAEGALGAWPAAHGSSDAMPHPVGAVAHVGRVRRPQTQVRRGSGRRIRFLSGRRRPVCSARLRGASHRRHDVRPLRRDVPRRSLPGVRAVRHGRAGVLVRVAGVLGGVAVRRLPARAARVRHVLGRQQPGPGDTAVRARPAHALVEGGFRSIPTLTNVDPPAHNRTRRIAYLAFTPRRVAQLEGFVRETVRRFIAERFAEGRADIVAALTWELPAQVIFQVLGVPA